MEEYKGIYYGDETEQNYYEGGAHFKYIKLYKILEKLAKERNAEEKKQNMLYVHKSNNLNKSNNKNINKKTRNIIDNIDANKFQYNTINNNYNNINYNFQNNYNIFLSINKENNKNKLDNNLSIPNHKKEIDSRNKDSIKAFKGRPNTILKESLQKILYTKKNKILSSSMENKNNTKIKVKLPLNLKKFIPDFNPNNTQKINNYSLNKTYKNDGDINLNNNSTNRIKDYNNDDSKSLILNNNNNNTINNHIQPNIQNIQNISYSNVNKMSLKTERIQPVWGKKKEKRIVEKNNQLKENNNIFNKINFSNSIKISRKTHNIINKRIIGKKNIDNNSKEKSIIVSEILNKTKIDKAKINLFLNKSNKKKNIKNDFNFLDGTLLEKTNYKNNQYNSFRKDLINDNKILTEKKLLNLKKIDKYNLIKSNNNQLSFNKVNNKSRNYNVKNASFQIKKTFNQNNSINNKNKDSEIFKNFFKTMEEMNKMDNTYINDTNKKMFLNLNDSNNKNKLNKNKNLNFVYSNSNKKRINNNKTLMPNNINLNELLKKQYEIKPYIQIKPYNGSKKKIDLNRSIKVNKKIHTHNIPKKNNGKIDIKLNNIKI